MNRKKIKSGFLLKRYLILLPGLLFLLASSQSMAFQRNVSRTGANGKTFSRDIMTNRTAHGYERNVTKTGPQGNTADRSATGQWDAESGTWSRNITKTGPSGQSSNRTTTATRTEDGYNKTATATGPQGNSASREVNGQWDPETRTWTKTVSTSGAE